MISTSTPSLPNRLCRDRSDLFDSEHPDDIDQAVTICGHCRDREPFRRWAASQNPYTLNGVIAGRHYRPDHKKKGATP